MLFIQLPNTEIHSISYQQNIIDSMVRNAYNYNIMMTRDVKMLGLNDSSP